MICVCVSTLAVEKPSVFLGLLTRCVLGQTGGFCSLLLGDVKPFIGVKTTSEHLQALLDTHTQDSFNVLCTNTGLVTDPALFDFAKHLWCVKEITSNRNMRLKPFHISSMYILNIQPLNCYIPSPLLSLALAG